MKIIRLSAENFKRLRAVEITPSGNVVEIRGRNGAGKSSILDAIECAVMGGDVLPSRPIRRGEETAKIRLDLGALIVTRRFTGAGSTLTVEAESGALYRSPQHMLDELIGAIAFDPLEFTRMKPKEQLEELRRLVKLDVDIDCLDRKNAIDYEQRTRLGRDIRTLRGQASGIQFPDDLPDAPVDVSVLAQRLRHAGDENTQIERGKAQREAAAVDVAIRRRRAQEHREGAEDLRRRAEELDRAAAEFDARAARIEKEIAEAPALPSPVDTNNLVAEIEAARTVNSHIDAKRRRETLEAEAAALKARVAKLTELMEERTEAKRAAIAAAQMPVAGLGFGDGEVLFRDLPLDQASQAEKIRVSVALAMAANPKLKVLCVRDGSLLDQESWRLLTDLVDGADYQCWVEVTDNDGNTGIVIEDGAVRQPALAL
jgi:hypothetical protein